MEGDRSEMTANSVKFAQAVGEWLNARIGEGRSDVVWRRVQSEDGKHSGFEGGLGTSVIRVNYNNSIYGIQILDADENLLGSYWSSTSEDVPRRLYSAASEEHSRQSVDARTHFLDHLDGLG